MVFGREHKLSVKLQYKSTVVAVEIPASATFGELRYEAASRIGIPADAFVLKFRGREKANSEGLLTAGLKNGACVLAQETAVHEAIRGASFAGLEQQTRAAKPAPAHYQQSLPLRQQQATARAHSSTGGSSHSAAAAAASHLDPRAQSFTPPSQGSAQGGHPRVYIATNGHHRGSGGGQDKHSLQQNEVHGVRYPQTSFTAGGQASGLVNPPRSPEAGVPANWEGQFTSSDGPSRAGPRMSQQRQHHADYYTDSIEEDRRRKRHMFEQHQAMQRQQAEAHDQKQQHQQQQAGGQQPLPSQQGRFVGPQPQLSLEEQLLAKVTVQEREMDAFAQQVNDYTGSNGDCANREGALKQKLILTELLTRVMLALDGVRPPDGGETPMAVRTARKAAIIRAQALIDRVEFTSAANAASVR